MLVLCCWGMLCPFSAQAQPSRGTTLALTVGPECAIGIVSQSQGDANSKTVTFNYKIRTAGAGGQGRITLRLTNYPAGSKVEYRTMLGGPGTPAAGVTTSESALNSGIVIAEFGPQTHSSRAGDSGTVQLTVDAPSTLLPEQLQPSLSISCQ
jgi:hypothetical protein